ncbi:hypothetical protein EON65_28400 [archaeon]|nr:MAG: hypothetical protein EON65_28400 [archaeon]
MSPLIPHQSSLQRSGLTKPPFGDLALDWLFVGDRHNHHISSTYLKSLSSMDDYPLVQWSFLQYKRTNKSAAAPTACFLHSTTQIGSKIMVFGGSDFYGEGLNQLLIYDTASFLWSAPKDCIEFQEDHPGGRYGHTATLIEMHPPKVMIYGGMINGGTFEFDAPDTPDGTQTSNQRSFMSWRKKGKKSLTMEDTDDSVYFLTLKADQWVWSKPLVHGGKQSKPEARAEHSACKTGTNEVTIFGGWTSQPTNDMWTFNFVDMEWRPTITSGIQPRSRYRHTAEVIGTKMFLLGGSDNGDDSAEESKSLGLHELNLETMQWNHPTISGANPFPRSGHASSVIGAYSIALFGGKRNNTVKITSTSM